MVDLAAAEWPAYDVLAAAAARAGVDPSSAALIRSGSNVLYRLGGVVARIGPVGSTPVAVKELRVSEWLRRHDIPVVAVCPIETEQPVTVDGRPVTFWELLPSHRPSTPGELGATLRALHRLPLESIALPDLDPFAGLSDTVARPVVPPEHRDFLARYLAGLRAEYADPRAHGRSVVLHGDAWQGNCVVPTGRQPTLLDLEAFCVGPPAWDLVNVAADYVDFDRLTPAEYAEFVTAYGSDVTTEPGFRVLASIQELRWTCFALRRAEAEPRYRAEASHRIACLRDEVPRPWTWSAI